VQDSSLRSESARSCVGTRKGSADGKTSRGNGRSSLFVTAWLETEAENLS
jgi:hypothetical protein